MPPVFLDRELVLEYHADQLELFAGGEGLRDLGLLESALAQPEATFGGEYLHTDLHAMAAAYLFHLVQNHPFVDGNKRIGLICALVFLELNGLDTRTEPALYELTMDVASGQMDKPAIAVALRRLFPAATEGSIEDGLGDLG